MADTFFVHIGLHKTGSTAIQKFLTNNAAELRRDGLLYPKTGRGRIAHHEIAWLLRNGSAAPWPDLREEMAGTGKAVLSSEEFSTVRPQQAWKLLRDNLPGTVRILCYLRRQDEMLESAYNQHIKSGGSQPVEVFKRKALPKFDYLARLQPLADVFGVENVIVRPYDKARMPDALFADFLSAVGLDMKARYTCPTRPVNPSLNDTGIALMRFVREQFPNPVALWCARQVANRLFYRRPSQSPRLMLSPDERRDVLSRFAESNAEVARRYLRRTELFPSDPEDLPRRSPADLDVVGLDPGGRR